MDATDNYGELVPQGGGDTIPLVREILVLGRRESCDVCLRFANVSGRHCELSFKDGYWYVRDLDSTNGIKVNDRKVLKKLLQPGDTITIAKRTFAIQYTAPTNRVAPLEEDEEDLMDKPLLEKAGLEKPRRHDLLPPGKRDEQPTRRLSLDEEDDEDDV